MLSIGIGLVFFSGSSSASASASTTNAATSVGSDQLILSEWSRGDINKIARLAIAADAPLLAPTSDSNQYADNALAAKLGEAIFFDQRFSANKKTSCASCHQPEKAFTEGHAMATGTKLTIRNTPTVIGSANYKWWYWDGRADSLWSQALIPFESPDEMASSRTAILKTFVQDANYVEQYQSIFGDLPSSEFLATLSGNASPLGVLAVRTAWYQLDQQTRQRVNHFYANIGKSIAAYERTLSHKMVRFDRFAQALLLQQRQINGQKSEGQGRLQSEGQGRLQRKEKNIVLESSILSKQEIQGLQLYIDDNKTHCRNCHNGALFSNSEFYDVGTAKLSGRHADFGRSLGLAAARRSEFNCFSAYSDVAEPNKKRQCRLAKIHDDDASPFMLGAYKTPTLRGLKHTAPYFHDGSMESLEDVIQHYLKLDMSAKSNQRLLDKKVAKAKSQHQLPPIVLNEQESAALIAFIKTLSSENALLSNGSAVKSKLAN